MKILDSKIMRKIINYPFSMINKGFKNAKNKNINIIDFGIGDPKTLPPQNVLNNIGRFAYKRSGHGYPDYIGDEYFRRVCAYYLYDNYNVVIDYNEQISSTIGSKEAIFNFPIGFINPGDIVICPTPGYPVYQIGTRLRGGVVYNVSLEEKNNFLIDFESIPNEVAIKAKLIWINYPNSPTGVFPTKKWLKMLVAWAKKFNIIIASDEGCYHEFYSDTVPISILEVQQEGVVTFYSLSKICNMTGYRIGFVAGDSKIVRIFRRVKTNIDSGSPVFIQDVACLALKNKKFIFNLRNSLIKKRVIMNSSFFKIGLKLSKSTSSLYLWQKVPIGVTDIEFARKLMLLGIITIPGTLISENIDGYNPGAGYIRVALVPSISRVKQASQRILDFFKNINFK